MERKLKLIIVDDVDQIRKGLRDYLEIELGHNILAEATDGLEFLDLPNIPVADIVLMDIEMPRMDGIESAKRVLWQYPSLKIIAITMHQDKAYLTSLIEAGFKGCIFKNNIYDELQLALNQVINNKFYFPEHIKI